VVRINSLIRASQEEWGSEDLYRSWLNNQRTDWAVLAHHGERVYNNPNRVRILVLGDSFTYGTGLIDMEARWTSLLEEELNLNTAPGAFEVVGVGFGGASTYSHAKLAEMIATGNVKDVCNQCPGGEALSGNFDIVLVGYVHNDRYPNWFDTNLPESLQSVARAAGFEDPTRPRELSLDDLQAILHDKSPDPNEALFSAAAAHIKSSLPGAKALWMPLSFLEYSRQESLREAPIFAEAGFTVLDTPNLDELVVATPGEELMVTQVDPHPGTPVLHAYARDAADGVLAVLDPDRVESAVESSGPVESKLLTYVAPLEAIVEYTENASSNTAVLELNSTRSRTTPCKDYRSNGSLVACENGVPVFYLRREYGETVDQKTGRRAVAQFAPCVDLGTPYASVSFSRPAGKVRMEVTADAAVTKTTLSVYALAYDALGFITTRHLKDLDPGDTMSITTGEDTRALMFADAVAPVSCRDGESTELHAPDMKLTFTW